MSGSPAYLDLLKTFERPIGQYRMSTGQLYEDLENDWSWFERAQNETTLRRLADQALQILVQATGNTRLQVIEQARSLHLAKNAGYAGDNPDPWANFRLSQAFGIEPIRGVYVRMSDKMIRIRNLRSNPQFEQVGEAIIDTVADLFAYALIAICMERE